MIDALISIAVWVWVSPVLLIIWLCGPEKGEKTKHVRYNPNPETIAKVVIGIALFVAALGFILLIISGHA